MALLKRKDTSFPLTMSTYWTILPKDTNYMDSLVFGGSMSAQIDLAVVQHVRQLLHFSTCNRAVTYEINNKFLGPAYSGDTIKFNTELIEVRDNAIVIEVEAWRNPLKTELYALDPEWERIGIHKLIFVTKQNENFRPHGLKQVIKERNLILRSQIED